MTNEPPRDPVIALAVRTTLGVMHALAEDRLKDLDIDPPEYIADLYCLDRVANILGVRFILSRGHDGEFIVSLVEASMKIRQMLTDAYARHQVDSRAWCLNLNRAMIQRHPDPASGM